MADHGIYYNPLISNLNAFFKESKYKANNFPINFLLILIK